MQTTVANVSYFYLELNAGVAFFVYLELAVRPIGAQSRSR